jgi:omega-amidase
MAFQLCAAQLAGFWEEPKASLEKARSAVRTAADTGASIICFPEQYATGWDPLAATHIQSVDGTIVSGFQRLARDHGIAVLGSFRERHGPSPLNTAVAIDARGRIAATYSKIHLFSPGNEQQAFSAGNRPATFTVDGICFGISICYDLRFSELFAAYASLGTDAVLVPAAWPCERIRHWELFIRTRALEHQIVMAGINTTGDTPVGQYCGGSMVADPWGEILCRAGEGEGLIMATIDPSTISEARERLPIHSDRRSDLYKQFLHKEP